MAEQRWQERQRRMLAHSIKLRDREHVGEIGEELTASEQLANRCAWCGRSDTLVKVGVHTRRLDEDAVYTVTCTLCARKNGCLRTH